ncbi:MAG: hypothetical protein Q9222_001938 [Ikaeria aurantiellina]
MFFGRMSPTLSRAPSSSGVQQWQTMIPATNSLSVDESFLEDGVTFNGSSLSYGSPDQYTGPLNAQKVVMCDGANFGTGLDLLSCQDALKQLDKGHGKMMSFAQRGTSPRANQALPMRTSSGRAPFYYSANRSV